MTVANDQWPGERAAQAYTRACVRRQLGGCTERGRQLMYLVTRLLLPASSLDCFYLRWDRNAAITGFHSVRTLCSISVYLHSSTLSPSPPLPRPLSVSLSLPVCLSVSLSLSHPLSTSCSLPLYSIYQALCLRTYVLHPSLSESVTRSINLIPPTLYLHPNTLYIYIYISLSPPFPHSTPSSVSPQYHIPIFSCVCVCVCVRLRLSLTVVGHRLPPQFCGRSRKRRHQLKTTTWCEAPVRNAVLQHAQKKPSDPFTDRSLYLGNALWRQSSWGKWIRATDSCKGTADRAEQLQTVALHYTWEGYYLYMYVSETLKVRDTNCFETYNIHTCMYAVNDWTCILWTNIA